MLKPVFTGRKLEIDLLSTQLVSVFTTAAPGSISGPPFKVSSIVPPFVKTFEVVDLTQFLMLATRFVKNIPGPE